jgi:hypothetical protein
MEEDRGRGTPEEREEDDGAVPCRRVSLYPLEEEEEDGAESTGPGLETMGL